jgi:PAS domain S-box-containing protein
VLAVSDHYLNLVHKRREEVIGHSLFEIFPGSAGDASEQWSVYSSFCRVIAGGRQDVLPVFKYEIYLEESGTMETFYWSNINDPVFNASGEVEYIINSTTNITKQMEQEALLADVSLQIESLQRKQVLNAEVSATNEELLIIQQEMFLLNQELEARVEQRTQSLAESEARFRNMAENSAILIAVSDKDNLPVYFNFAWTLLTGREQEKLLAINLVKILHPFDQQQFRETLKESREQHKSWKMEFRVINKDGYYCWLLANGTVRYDADGNYAGYVTSCTDITENKEQQAELEKLNLDLETAYHIHAASNVELARVNDELLSIQDMQEAHFLLGSQQV